MRNHAGGLDAVRVLAVGLVAAQHALTLLNVESGPDIGQVGVALFLAVSGLLAADTRRPPLGWLGQRLRRLLPAYWLAMAVAFAAAWGSVPFDALQVVCQFLGVGLFTHQHTLVNPPTWFLTLVLVCYAGTAAGRMANVPRAGGVGACVALAAAVAVGFQPWLLGHALVYALAFTLAFAPPRLRPKLAALAAVALAVLAAGTGELALLYPAMAVVGVELAAYLPPPPRVVRWAADHAYEFFLLHWVTLAWAVAALPAAPGLAIGLGVGLAVVGAVVLKPAVNALDRVTVRQLGGRSPPVATGGRELAGGRELQYRPCPRCSSSATPPSAATARPSSATSVGA